MTSIFSKNGWLTAVVGILLLLSAVLTVSLLTKNQKRSSDLEETFEKGISIQEFYPVAKKGPLEEVYRLLKDKFSQNPVSAHDYVHVIGEVAYQTRGENGITLCDALSSYGCFHGFLAAFIVELGAEALPKTELACKKLGPADIPSCLHGIGHGVMAWRNYELGSSLNLCDDLEELSRIYCYDGVFMESFTNSMLPPEKRIARKQDPDDPWLPCTELQERYLMACYRQKVFDLFGFLGGDFKKLADLCLTLPAKYVPICVESYGYRVAISVQTQLEEINRLCGFLESGSERDECLLAAMAELSFEGRSGESIEKICGLVGSGRTEECRAKLKTLQEIHQARFGK